MAGIYGKGKICAVLRVLWGREPNEGNVALTGEGRTTSATGRSAGAPDYGG